MFYKKIHFDGFEPNTKNDFTQTFITHAWADISIEMDIFSGGFRANSRIICPSIPIPFCPFGKNWAWIDFILLSRVFSLVSLDGAVSQSENRKPTWVELEDRQFPSLIQLISIIASQIRNPFLLQSVWKIRSGQDLADSLQDVSDGLLVV